MKKLFAGIIALCSITFTVKAQDAGYKAGSEVQDFNLKNIDGKMISLASINASEGYILIFTCNHCPYAKAYENRIIELHKRFAPQGYPVVAINPNDPKQSPDDSYAKMKVRAKEKNFPFVYLYDETQEVAKRFGAAKTPHVFLIQNKGDKRIVQYVGAIDDNWENENEVEQQYIVRAISFLKAGNPVPKTETKAIGCTIKWKK